MSEEKQQHDDVQEETVVEQEELASAKATAQQGKPCKKCGQAPDQLEQYKQGWQRAQADYQNLVREMDSKKSELVAWSKQMILEDFIPVYDNFKKAFDMNRGTEAKEWENWAKGIEYIKKQFGDVLKKQGITEMETVGKMFDPTMHEAMQEEESDEAEGTILKELDAGYMMGEKVVKVAKVVVAKSKDEK